MIGKEIKLVIFEGFVNLVCRKLKDLIIHIELVNKIAFILKNFCFLSYFSFLSQLEYYY